MFHMTAGACNHRLSWPKALVASGPFKFRCDSCGAVVYRRHPLTAGVYRALNLDGMGITVALVLIVAVAFLPWVAGVVATVSLAAYSWDLKRQPIIEFFEAEVVKQQRTNVVFFVVLAAILLLLIVDGLK